MDTDNHQDESPVVNVESIDPHANMATLVKKKSIPDEEMENFVELIKTIAASIVSGGKIPAGVEFEDLVSYGYEGLHKAWQAYNQERGAGFKTYATYRIRGEMLDRMRKEWKYRNPGQYQYREKLREKTVQIANENMQELMFADQKTGKSDEGHTEKRFSQMLTHSAMSFMISLDNLGEVSTRQDTQDVSDSVSGKQNVLNEKVVLQDEIKNLEENEQRFIQLFYDEHKTQKEIAVVLGISKSKASRVHVKILEKLKRRIKRKLEQEKDH
jgi:RNA polymerase sigma factor FliA